MVCRPWLHPKPQEDCGFALFLFCSVQWRSWHFPIRPVYNKMPTSISTCYVVLIQVGPLAVDLLLIL